MSVVVNYSKINSVKLLAYPVAYRRTPAPQRPDLRRRKTNLLRRVQKCAINGTEDRRGACLWERTGNLPPTGKRSLTKTDNEITRCIRSIHITASCIRAHTMKTKHYRIGTERSRTAEYKQYRHNARTHTGRIKPNQTAHIQICVDDSGDLPWRKGRERQQQPTNRAEHEKKTEHCASEQQQLNYAKSGATCPLRQQRDKLSKDKLVTVGQQWLLNRRPSPAVP